MSNAAVLSGPLGIAIRPNNGHILAVNGNDGMLVELTAGGQVVNTGMLDSQGTPPGAGTLFGVATGSAGLYFVNDGTNTLNLLANPL